MKERKPKLYIVPGWGEKVTLKSYRDLIVAVEDKYEIVPINYASKKGYLLSKNIESAAAQIGKPSPQDVIFGFSIGALIAYQIAAKYKFKSAIICSPSAILNGDLKQYPQTEVRKLFTDEEIKELNRMKYEKPRTSMIFMHGEMETKEANNRLQKLYKQHGGVLVSIGKWVHTMSGKYLEQVIKQLN